MAMSNLSPVTVVLLLLMVVLRPSPADSLQLLDQYQPSSSLLPRSFFFDHFLDPFHILEHVPTGLEQGISPARVDWKETPHSHLLILDVPGLGKEDLKIEVDEDGVLRISGERRKEEELKDDHWHCVERVYGKFLRLFRLPEKVDVDNIKAKLEGGVLTVHMSKLPPAAVDEGKSRAPAVGGSAEGVQRPVTQSNVDADQSKRKSDEEL
ncbi:heat shock protein [Nymphaea thermarum]|nr:heat shock protein [Nymphaea thermarum]